MEGELLEEFDSMMEKYGKDKYPQGTSIGTCGACGKEEVPVTYRIGLDLFLCFPCSCQPNLGMILLDELVERKKKNNNG